MDATTYVKPFDVSKIENEIDGGLNEILKQEAASFRRPIEKTTKPTEKLLEDRQTTHGSFEDNARISQGIKEWLRGSPGWAKLTDVEREAMDMVALKFSRILSGRSLEKQHWEDVVGYSQLALKQCV